MEITLPNKLYYTTNEVAKAFGVNASLVRFWEKELKILKPHKDERGTRKFTPDDVRLLQRIYHLVKEQGFTLEGARQKLKEDKHQALSTLEMITKLETVKQQLLSLKDAL